MGFFTGFFFFVCLLVFSLFQKRQGKTKIEIEGHYGCFCDVEVIYQTEEGASLKIPVEIIKGQERTERGEEAPIFQCLLFPFLNYGMKTEDDRQI